MLLDIARQQPGAAWSASTGRTRTPPRSDWLTQLGNPYSVVAVDREGRTAIDFGVYGAPETFFIDAGGLVQYRHVGADDAPRSGSANSLSRLPRGALP